VQAVLAEVAKPTPSDHGELSTVGGGGSPAPPAGATWFGRFVIEGRLGAGGMGEVFRARDGQRPIALKLMRPEIAADPRHRLMFVTEAQLAARLRHRNLVRLHDFGNTNGLLWMALDLVDGLPLDRLLDGGALPPAVAGHVALELLDALAYVHAHAMVHRDVSAANVLVSTAGAIKLSDFGVAKLSTRSMTLTNEEKGKPSYMAPEQLREHAPKGPIDGRVDLFAVGVLLHRMTQGEAPFSDVGAWLRAGAPRTATGPMAAVIARAMQPDRRERFADAKSMAAAILRDLPAAADGDAAGVLAGRVRDCAAVATPMEDFDRLIIAALGAQALPPLDDDSATALDLFSDQMPTNLREPAGVGDEDYDVETRRGALSLAALVPLGDSFSEQISTQMREPAATLADGGFGEETTTKAVQFDDAAGAGGVRVRPGDSISDAICTSPNAVEHVVDPPPLAPPPTALVAQRIDDALTSLPLAFATSPAVLLPAPLSRRWLWLAGAAAIVALLALLLALVPSRRAHPPLVTPAPARVAIKPAPAPAPAAPARPAHHHGPRSSKLASRSSRG